MWISRSISRQIMALVILSFAVFSIGVAALIGLQSYNDLEELVYERTHSAARLFKTEYEGQVRRAHTAISNVELNQLIAESLTLLTTNGPLYVEDPSSIGKPIPESENNYYLQSQIQLANALITLLPQYGLSQLSIYHLAPFDQFSPHTRLLSMVIDYEHLWLYRYYEKSDQPKFSVYRIPISELNYDDQLFDVSSIYQHEADYFYDRLRIPQIEETAKDYLQSIPKDKYFSGRSIQLSHDELSIGMWSAISLALSNPATWQAEYQYSALVVGVMLPSQEGLQQIGEQIGTELAIADNDHVWVSSIDLYSLQKSGYNLQLEDRPFVFSEVKLGIPSFNDSYFKVMALTSTENLQIRTLLLITRLSVITLVVLLVTALAMYLLINYTLQSPLKVMLSSVKSVEQGDLDAKVHLSGQNELSTLAGAFNDMMDTIKTTSQDLKTANETLEQKVKDRTADLVEAQQQLIMAEKMASLGQLVAGVAHEINTPLGNSITALSFSKENFKHIKELFDAKKVKTSDFEQYLGQTEDAISLIEANLFKASELVTTFKRVAVDQSVEELTEFNLKQHIEEVLMTLKPKLKQTQVNIHLHMDDNLTLRSYPGTYYHIISNMVMNCINHAFPEKQGNIDIRADIRTDNESLRLVFKDDGVGMDAATKAKIFDPFYTTKRGSGGTGLGMYMTYNMITQKLGGRIEVESELGHGVTFTIKVPLTPPDDSEPANGGFTV